MNIKYTIFINESPFTADEETIDQVIEAIEKKGFVFDLPTQGYYSPDFHADTGENQ